MTSEPALALGVIAVLIAVVALLLARSRRKQARRARELAAAVKTADTRAQAATALAHSAEERRQAAEARTKDAETRDAEFRDEVRHLVSARLPALALHLISAHHPIPGLLHENLVGSGAEELLDSVLDHVSATVVKERRRVDAAARAALRGTSQDSQALSYRLQTEIDALQHEFSAPRSLTNRLLAADHLNEQNLRLIQRAAIVCGAWPGHVRKDTYVAEIVSGASSRLRGFDRVKISSRLRSSNIAVVGRAAEPIAVACAELMANALEHSRDDLVVDVSLLQTGNGSVCITIDDAGKGMTAEAISRGARLISADQQEVMLTELGDPPSQGFAAIGSLVADYGFHVSIDNPSPYGGVRAVVSVPPNLLTTIDEEAEPLSAMAPLPAVAPQVDKRPAPAESAEPPTRTPVPTAAAAAPELPQRQRRSSATSSAEASAPAHRLPDPERERDMWSDFQEGLASGQTDTDSEESQ
ncbi:ATP-binding protein [Streptomyces sp. 150FB]|uniref:ATP-binding protein n=1 Tax=Streptomyces sp. 150FB TaxID=1576605 RepID=UPI000698CCB9|nr:ATP-binding protein [Streptomyces sp. 150FB]